MTRQQIYNCVELLDFFGDHSSILGLSVSEIELLNLIKVDLIRRDKANESLITSNDLRVLRGGIKRRQAAGID